MGLMSMKALMTALMIFIHIPQYADYTLLEDNYRMVLHNGDAHALITQEEIDLMARVVMSEAGNQDIDCKEAVATVILNRWVSPNYPVRIKDVIYSEGQFSTADNGTPTDECYQAVYSAIVWFGTENAIVPKSCYYFRAYHYHEWAIDYCQLDDMYFSLGKDADL